MSKEYPPQQLQHQPVLLEATLSLLQPALGETYLDLTAGRGGHASRIIERIGASTLATLVDRDSEAIAYLRGSTCRGARLIQADFASCAQKLAKQGEQFDMVLIDLGVSSPQLDAAERGFAFRLEAPLDMRMDQAQGQTAADLVNQSKASALTDIIRRYGEESTVNAKKIAAAIIAARPILTTTQLAEVVKQQLTSGWSKIHPATRTFQALRIAVNDELGQISTTLPLLPSLLKPGGRVAVISFHSLEDRLVKRFFKEEAAAGYEARLRLLTKKPIAGDINDVHNPRARSAKLRGAVKIKTKERTS